MAGGSTMWLSQSKIGKVLALIGGSPSGRPLGPRWLKALVRRHDIARPSRMSRSLAGAEPAPDATRHDFSCWSHRRLIVGA
jgi:hypothetical protein